jgi:hypothetical protein
MSGLFGDEELVTPVGWKVPLGWTAGDEGLCRSCRAPILWCTTPAGKKAPVNRDGTSHFATCPEANSWRRRGA